MFTNIHKLLKSFSKLKLLTFIHFTKDTNMVKIIRGKRYDTETATKLAEFHNGYRKNQDFNYLYESLFQKRTGEYFLYGEGGALSRWGVPCNDDPRAKCFGKGIQPLTEEIARAWVEEFSNDDYEAIFGECEE